MTVAVVVFALFAVNVIAVTYGIKYNKNVMYVTVWPMNDLSNLYLFCVYSCTNDSL